MGEPRAFLDDVSPQYDVRMQERVRVDASPALTYQALKNLRTNDTKLAKWLAFVRDPHWPRRGADAGDLLADEVERFGWVPLQEDYGETLVVGLVGRVWRRDFGIITLDSRQAFLDFDRPGFAKIVVGYKFDECEEGTCLRSETRVHVTDAVARRRFRWYWRFIAIGARLSDGLL